MSFLFKPQIFTILMVIMLTIQPTRQSDRKCSAGSSDCPKPRRTKRSDVPCFTLEAAVVLDHTVWEFFGSMFPGLDDAQREQNITDHFRRVYAEANTRLSYWKDYAKELERRRVMCQVTCFRVYPGIIDIQKNNISDWSSTTQLEDGQQYVVNTDGCASVSPTGADVTHCWTRLDVALNGSGSSQQYHSYYRTIGDRGMCSPSSVHVLEALGHGEDFLVAHAVMHAQGTTGYEKCYFWDRGNDVFPWITAVPSNPKMAEYLECMVNFVCHHMMGEPATSCAFQNSFTQPEWDSFASLSQQPVPYSFDQLCQFSMGLNATYIGKTAYPAHMCIVGIPCSDGSRHNNRYISVMSNTPCAEGKVCKKWTCQWKDLGDLGGHCYADTNCYKNNTFCNCGFCECRRGYRLSNGSCIPLKKITCSQGWLQYGSLCIYTNIQWLNFNNALAACNAWNGTLLEIDDELKKDFILNYLASDGPQARFWIGGRYTSVHGTMQWTWVSNNRTMDYVNWFVGDPRDIATKHCAHIWPLGAVFRNAACSDGNYSLCQRLSPTFDKLEPNEGYLIDE